MSYFTTLKGSKAVARDTLEVLLEKPDGLSFTAGQHADVSFKDASFDDPRGNVRLFSFASTPSEEHIRFATRLTGSPFKKALAEASSGTEFVVDDPTGNAVLHEDSSRPAVFLVGGIGITPARSIIRDAHERSLPHTISLFYSNRTQEDAAYHDEWRDLSAQWDRFSYIPTVTKEANPDGEEGFIDEEKLKRHLTDPQEAVYYIFGPPAMAQAMKELVGEIGVSDLQIRMEEFGGYKSNP